MTDRITKAWMRDESDKYAVQNGCWFDPLVGGYAVWWIERFCCLYEGEWAGEPMRLRGLHTDVIPPPGEPVDDAWPIPDEFNEELALSRAAHYAAAVKRGEPHDWQYDTIMRLFGWLRESQRWGRPVRRFRKASIWVAKKNKKSPTLAALGLYILCGDGEPGQKVFVGGKDGKQVAENIGKHSIEMVERSPELSAECTINRNKSLIAHDPTSSVMQPLSSSNARTQQSKEGLNGSLLVDETHVVDEAFIARVDRMGISRSEPLHLEFSTSGKDPDSYGKRRHDYAKDVAAGKIKNDSLLVIDYSAPQGLSDDDLEADPVKYGRMANPAWGHTIGEEEFLADYQESQQSERAKRDFKTYRLNIWQTSSSPWLPAGSWERAGQSYSLEDLQGEWCLAGFDKSRKRDFTALILGFPTYTDEGLSRLRLWPLIWAPEEYLEEHKDELPQLLDWREEGYLQVSPGNVIDVGHILGGIANVHRNTPIACLAYDPNQAEELTQLIEQGAIGQDGETLSEGLGIPRVAVGTRSPAMSAAIDEFEIFVGEGRLEHPNHPVLNWMVGNVNIKDFGDRSLLEKPAKNSPKKIDGAVASIIAFAIARHPEHFDAAGSAYDDEDQGVILL